MPTQVNASHLKELAERIQTLLKEFDIDVRMFTLRLKVSNKFYESIKENFPNRHEIDMIVGESESNWSIHLLCSLYDYDE